jgi:hypothetical protein
MINLTKEIFGFGEVLFNKTGKPIFMDSNYFKGGYYDFVNLIEKDKRNKSNCIYPNCPNKSIRNSHVIPQKTILKNIAKNGQVLYPKYLSDTKNYSFVSISINSASTFPGFCPEHEKIFFGFEKKEGGKDPSISLQNFRIICRDYFALKIRQKRLKEVYEQYKQEIFNYSNKLIELHNNLTNKKIKLLEIKDEITEDFENKLSFIDNTVAEIEKDLILYKDSYEKGNDDIVNYLFKFPCFLPLAFAGKSIFEVNHSAGKFKNTFTIYLSILPNKTDTILIFTFSEEYIECVNMILANYVDDFRMLSFIESFIIYGSDYWFINPDVWHNFSERKQDKIKSDLLITSYYPTKELDYSIFDDIRKELLEQYKKNKRTDLRSKLKNEERKLDFFDR